MVRVRAHVFETNKTTDTERKRRTARRTENTRLLPTPPWQDVIRRFCAQAQQLSVVTGGERPIVWITTIREGASRSPVMTALVATAATAAASLAGSVFLFPTSYWACSRHLFILNCFVERLVPRGLNKYLKYAAVDRRKPLLLFTFTNMIVILLQFMIETE